MSRGCSGARALSRSERFGAQAPDGGLSRAARRGGEIGANSLHVTGAGAGPARAGRVASRPVRRRPAAQAPDGLLLAAAVPGTAAAEAGLGDYTLEGAAPEDVEVTLE